LAPLAVDGLSNKRSQDRNIDLGIDEAHGMWRNSSEEGANLGAEVC
jgi:hypothetical protein